MKHPEFDMSLARWDAYKAFYMTFGTRYYEPFVLFDTGELIVRESRFQPESRVKYGQLNVEVVSTHDNSCPTFRTPDGEELKKAWLPSQTLLIDHDTGYVVSLDGRDFTAEVPTRFQNRARAYFPGAGQHPVGRAIRVERPAKRTEAEREHLEQLRAACKAWATMSEDAPKMQSSRRNIYTPSVDWKKVYTPDPTFYEPCPFTVNEAMALSFEAISNSLRMRVVVHGFTANTESVTYNHLLLA